MTGRVSHRSARPARRIAALAASWLEPASVMRGQLAALVDQDLFVMAYSGPIELDQLIDPETIREQHDTLYSFLALPLSGITADGVPSDDEAQRYIAAVQAQGVPVGIWLTTGVERTAYAVVCRENVPLLHKALQTIEADGNISRAAELCERLFREHDSLQ